MTLLDVVQDVFSIVIAVGEDVVEGIYDPFD